MKLFIPAEIQERIPDLPSGTVLLGEYSEDWGAASVVGFMEPGDGGVRRHADTLAQLGGSGRSTPFRVTIGAGGAPWFHHGDCRVEVVVYEPSDYFKRTPFNEGVMGYLREERVLIVGMGSVGAFMGLEMAKSGVGSLIAVDKDHLEVHN